MLLAPQTVFQSLRPSSRDEWLPEDDGCHGLFQFDQTEKEEGCGNDDDHWCSCQDDRGFDDMLDMQMLGKKKIDTKESKYRVGSVLGIGSYGEVRYATRKKDGLPVAMKIVDVKCQGSLVNAMMKREIEHLQELDHPNVVRLVEILTNEPTNGTWCSLCACSECRWDDKGQCVHCSHESYYHEDQVQSREVLIVVQELGINGDLFSFLTTLGFFPETLARKFFKDLISGLEHCHSKGIVHRDIKPENMVLDENYNLKLIDFGLAAKSSKAGATYHSGVGSQPYTPPEVLYNIEEGKKKRAYRGEPADLWSCAVSLYVFLTGYHPYRRPLLKSFGDKPEQQACPHFAALLRGESYEGISKEAKDLLMAIFRLDPEKRLNISQIKSHPWMKGPVKSYRQILMSIS